VTGTRKETNLVRETAKSLYNAGISYARGDIDAIVNAGFQLFNRVTKGKDAKEKSLRTKSSEADVIQFSGCKDYEKAKDTVAAVIPPPPSPRLLTFRIAR
jgi:metacaspase-1